MTQQLRPAPPVSRDVAWHSGPRADRARQRLLDAAQTVLLDRGYSGTRVQDIADLAGVSRRSFYLYFASKYDAFLALGTDSATASGQRLERLRAIPTDWSDEDLRAWLTDWFDHLERFGAFERIWRHEAPEPIKAEGVEVERRHARRLGREIERLRGRASATPVLLGMTLQSVLEGLWYYSKRDPAHASRDEIIESLVDAMRCLLV